MYKKMTVKEIVNLTINFLKNKNLPNFRYSSENIIAESLNLNRIDLYIQFERPLTDEEILICRKNLQAFINQQNIEYNLIDIFQYFLNKLKKNYITEAKRSVEEIFSYVLNIKRLELAFNHNRIVNHEEYNLIQQYINRRLQKEPLQYIFGRTSFYDLDFFVTKDVLIPRPETEELIEKIVNTLKNIQNLQILDIGTGSACIAITLKKKLINSTIYAWDISEKALLIAEKNANFHHVEIIFEKIDILDSRTNFQDFDIIVSNPPYISLAEHEILQDEVRDYEPSIALHDNSDGYSFYKAIFDKINKMSKQPLYAFFEIGANQADFLLALSLNFFSNAIISIEKDICGRDRFLIIQFL
jgi:release factor glutamine methyltransferase